MNCKPVIYYAEGECEKKLLCCLKDHNLITQGRVQVFNVIQNKLSKAKLMSIKPESTIILVFDADVNTDLSIYRENCKEIKNTVVKPTIYNLVQIKNLEEELKRATNVSQIKELTGSKSNSDFKSDFVNLSDCYSTLLNHDFDITQLWQQKPSGVFSDIKQSTIKVIRITK